jgi:hypothetical protein
MTIGTTLSAFPLKGLNKIKKVNKQGLPSDGKK